MKLGTNGTMAAAAALCALLSSAPAWADVRAGVDAWSRGDYATAVREWEGPAAAGDPDAESASNQELASIYLDRTRTQAPSVQEEAALDEARLAEVLHRLQIDVPTTTAP